MGENCNIAPEICTNCSYVSSEDKTRHMCKLCKVTERMENIDIDAMEIDTSVNSHNIECVASVSFDR